HQRHQPQDRPSHPRSGHIGEAPAAPGPPFGFGLDDVHAFETMLANARSGVKRSTNISLPFGRVLATMGGASVPAEATTRSQRGSRALNQELSERQARILDYIRHVTRARAYPPSVRAIGA